MTMIVLKNGQTIYMSEDELTTIKENWQLYEELGKDDSLFIKKLVELGIPSEAIAKSILVITKWMREMNVI